MPQIGDRDIGTNIGNHSWGYYQYIACPDCGFTRWVAEKSTRDNKGLCRQCQGKRMRGIPKLTIRGDKNPAWNGGRLVTKQGYIRMRLLPNDPMFSMTGSLGVGHTDGYIFEHRYVMARHLGRPLETWEVVHHKNGDKKDNRIENLELLPDRQNHMAFTLLQQEVEQLRSRVKDLEAKVTLLEAEKVLSLVTGS